ncbi:MAG: thiazole synthase [Bdellovibrionaceae bacterium]|nr:thiazole synthase [Bdellovibrionales bacterium]MCB9254103.1 thiazole synthase [Pseudobdellovibrionaceae bacterium]
MWKIADVEIESRLFLGTAQYRNPELLRRAIVESGTQVVTVSLRRQSKALHGAENFWGLIQQSGVRVLPNTAGCRSVKEAVSTAQMARQVFDTNWIKLEVVGNEHTLQPDPFGLVEAARILCEDGFYVFPYTNDDPVVAERLLAAGCRILMPWGAPIGSGRGLQNEYALKVLRDQFPHTPLLVDAGIGAPSHAARAMELGYDGVLLNTAVARSEDPPKMAKAFAQAVEAGRLAYEAGLIQVKQKAEASTPVLGTPFWQHELPRGTL